MSILYNNVSYEIWARNKDNPERDLRHWCNTEDNPEKRANHLRITRENNPTAEFQIVKTTVTVEIEHPWSNL